MKLKVKKTKRTLREQRKQEIIATAHRISESVKAGNPLPLPDVFDQYITAPGNDLESIGVTKDTAMALLGARLALGKWRSALDAVGCGWPIYMTARKRSKTYQHLADMVEEEIKNRRAALIEDSLFDSAIGDKPFREGFIPPDPKAAQLYLGGNIERYKPNQQAQAQQVIINLNSELLGNG